MTCFLASGLIMISFFCVNEGADQLRVNRAARAADQRFCFRFIESTLPVLPISEISAILCDCTAQFLSHLVGKADNRFCRDAPQ